MPPHSRMRTRPRLRRDREVATVTAPVSLVEGATPIPLATLDPQADTDLEARERWRQTIAARNDLLRTQLGLRADPLRLDESPDGLKLSAGGIAGTLRLGRVELDVAPKHVEDASSGRWRGGLLAMVERAARRRGAFSLSDRLDLGTGTFADHFAFTFAVALEHALRREPVRTYVTTREEAPVLRGRLLVAQQLRSSFTKPHLLACEVDRLDPNNPINRLVRWAGGQLLLIARDGRVRSSLSHHLGRLPEVSTTRPPLPFRASLPRQFAHYEAAVDLAVALTKAQGPHPHNASGVGAGYVIGTEKLFEEVIERSLVAIAARSDTWEVAAQHREVFAVPVTKGGTKYYSKPDNVLRIDDATRLIIDAKYKRFEDATDDASGSRPTNADLYQMAAAAVAHGCSRALLVYPRLDKIQTTGAIRWWKVDGWSDEAIRIGVATVDLDVLGERSGITLFDADLGERVKEALA